MSIKYATEYATENQAIEAVRGDRSLINCVCVAGATPPTWGVLRDYVQRVWPGVEFIWRYPGTFHPREKGVSICTGHWTIKHGRWGAWGLPGWRLCDNTQPQRARVDGMSDADVHNVLIEELDAWAHK